MSLPSAKNEAAGNQGAVYSFWLRNEEIDALELAAFTSGMKRNAVLRSIIRERLVDVQR
jgi:hypothetical protein